MNSFDGLNCHLGNIHRLSRARTRSISAENFTGEKGQGGMATVGTGSWAARELGPPWKLSPSIKIAPHSTGTLADLEGPGAVQLVWMSGTGNWRWSILRVHWDDQEQPSIECPLGDSFGNAWGAFAPVTSLAVGVHPGSGFNCYWPMPFRRRCRMTLENLDDRECVLYFQVDYALNDVPADAAYFHAQFRRVNPIRFERDLRVTVQALGWMPDHRYLPLQDDISSTVFWYQTLPTASFPPLPSREALQIN
jgi:hypothetical protein